MGSSAPEHGAGDRAAAARTWTAHADAQEVQGRLREPCGGGAADLPGIRLMASGLDSPAYNNGDVTDAGRVDLGQVREWYVERAVPWGVRVPSAQRWTAGHRLLEKRLMALPAEQLRVAPPVPGLSVRRAAPGDLAAVLAVDRSAFAADHENGPQDDLGRAWLEPHLSTPHVAVALAALDGAPVATGYCVLSTGRAGPAAALGGVAVVEHARRRGIGAAVSSWLLQHAVHVGARWAHLSPDTEQAARVYRRLGFRGCGSFTVHVDL